MSTEANRDPLQNPAKLKLLKSDNANWDLILDHWTQNLCYSCQEVLSYGNVVFDSGTKWPIAERHIEESADGDWAACRSCEMIEATASVGCYFCRAVMKTAILRDLWVDEDESGYAVDDDEIENCETSLKILYLNASSIAVFKATRQYYEIASSAGIIMITEEDLGPQSTDLNPDLALAPYGLQFIQGQLHNCLTSSSHHCTPSPDSKATDWPTRMLEISEDEITLKEFDVGKMPGQYAALRYCWGDKLELQQHPPYTSTNSTLPQLRLGLPTRSLPLTLQQSIQLCRWLSIPYIWIDSLCIIQDSRSDWETEAVKMGAVYSRSKVTIIAAESTSCHSGFFDLFLEMIDLNLPVHEPFRLVMRPASATGFHSGVARVDPIDRRGWTYQEELLSTRHIKITADDIQWKCCMGTTCLCGFGADPESMVQFDDMNSPGTIETWNKVVEGFSQRLLTVHTDKLLAISSVARKFATQIQSKYQDSGGWTVDYYAGIWAGGPLNYTQLLWYCINISDDMGEMGKCREDSWWRVPSTSVPERFVAPSFSWASLNLGPESPLSFKDIRNIKYHLAEVLDVRTTPTATGDKFGMVVNGAVRIKAPLLRCTVRSHPKDHGLIRLVDLPVEFVDDIPYFDITLAQYSLQSGQMSIRRSSHSESKPFKETPAWLLLLGGYCSRKKVHTYYALLLGMNDSGYERLGLMLLFRLFSADLREDGKEDGVVFEEFKATKQEITIF